MSSALRVLRYFITGTKDERIGRTPRVIRSRSSSVQRYTLSTMLQDEDAWFAIGTGYRLHRNIQPFVQRLVHVLQPQAGGNFRRTEFEAELAASASGKRSRVSMLIRVMLRTNDLPRGSALREAEICHSQPDYVHFQWQTACSVGLPTRMSRAAHCLAEPSPYPVFGHSFRHCLSPSVVP